MKPLVSAIVVNYNGKKWLSKCFTSLLSQSYKELEIIFVDNGSNDGSVELTKSKFPQIKVVQNAKNLGFAGGNNVGVSHAKGKYLLLINNDTYVKKDFLKNFVKAFDKIPKLAIAQSKIVLMDAPQVIDTCGSFWTDTSFLYHLGNGKRQSKKLYNRSFPVFTVKAASVLVKKSVVDKIGLFDDDFWSYYEETDFCNRAWLAGFECWYWPDATCYHAGGGTSTTLFRYHFIQFHNFKNKLLSFLKNYEARTLLTVVPKFLLFNISISIAWVLTGKFIHAISLYKAILWNCLKLAKTIEKRREIQALRSVSDTQIFQKIRRNPRPIFYYYLFKDELNLYED